MAQRACSRCQYAGKPEVDLRGSGSLQLLLLVLCLIPGIAYGIWRQGGTALRCPRCGQTVVPTQGAVGQVVPLAQEVEPPRPSRLQRASLFFKVFPLAGGVMFAVTFGASLFVPSGQGKTVLLYLVYAAGATILAHPVWLAIHLLLELVERARR